jgi:Threonine aldolase
MSAAQRHEFASDNTAPICPEAKKALDEVNRGSAAAYGEDRWTEQLYERIRELFGCDCAVCLVSNGTAANGLALAQVCRSFHAVVCHEYAHINTDEIGACAFFSGGSTLIPVAGAKGKLDLEQVARALVRQQDLHWYKPRVLSVTQATELGTIYSTNELRLISTFARERGMLLHMDGARFANAVAASRCPPKELSWQAGVDVLCFGGIKNGLAAGELIIFFDKTHAQGFEYRLKQGGQLTSKMRFLAAPWLGLLEADVWLKNAAHANSAARNLATALTAEGVEIVYPVEANAVFVRFDSLAIQKLYALGWSFYKFVEPDVYRLMCSWNTTEETISTFISDLQATKSCATAVH